MPRERRSQPADTMEDERVPLIEVFAVLSASFGVLMATSPLFQIRRILKRRSSADLSLASMSVIFIGSVVWFTYGTLLGNPSIMIANGVGILAWAAAIAVTLRFRSRAV